MKYQIKRNKTIPSLRPSRHKWAWDIATQMDVGDCVDIPDTELKDAEILRSVIRRLPDVKAKRYHFQLDEGNGFFRIWKVDQ